jgi:uncharacterized membrane protein
MDVSEFLAGAAHVLAAAVWLGAMAYSLAVVQPRSRRFLEDEGSREAFAATLAAGARYPVLGLIALLALSGGALAALGGDAGRPEGWWALVAIKGAVLAAALAIFAWVSWRLWPARLFAAPEELGAIRRRFAIAAATLTGLVATGTVLGVAARAIA